MGYYDKYKYEYTIDDEVKYIIERPGNFGDCLYIPDGSYFYLVSKDVFEKTTDHLDLTKAECILALPKHNELEKMIFEHKDVFLKILLSDLMHGKKYKLPMYI